MNKYQAQTMGDLLTPKQLVAISAIARAKGINYNAEAQRIYGLRPEELNKRAASLFITYLDAQPDTRFEQGVAA